MLIRLDKFLSEMNSGTRSEVKTLIRNKLVSVNNVVITKPETKIDTELDTVLVKNKPIVYLEFEYYMLNKPKGVVSATKDNLNKTIIDLITEKTRDDLFPVGRLDKDTEGLLLITNDGELAHNLLSPKKHVDKKYYAKVSGKITDEITELFSKGFKVDDSLYSQPSVLEIIRYDNNMDYSEIYITIQEGKFHQIKRMFAAVNSKVLYLKRVSFGPLILDSSLLPGEYRCLSKEELNSLSKWR